MAERIRPTSDSPLFVRRAALQRYAWAAAHVRGSSVLEVGAGTGEHNDALASLPEVAYLGVDDNPAGLGFVAARLPRDESQFTQHDTVVALEVLEHVPPQDQAGFLESCWALTRMRLLLSTPEADALRWYPRTDWFQRSEIGRAHV